MPAAPRCARADRASPHLAPRPLPLARGLQQGVAHAPSRRCADGQDNVLVARNFSRTVDFDPSAASLALTSAGNERRRAPDGIGQD
jgi:hypothetical protein